MPQKRELERMIETIHIVAWKIEEISVDRLMAQDTDLQDLESFSKATECLKKAVSHLISPASKLRLHNPSFKETLREIIGL
jgi:hypothetical protein